MRENQHPGENQHLRVTPIGILANEYHSRAGMGTNRQREQRCGSEVETRPCTSCILAALLIAGAVMITGCASTVADRTPTAVGGLPEGAPARPSTPSAYPAVNDLPPPRGSAVLSSAEQKKLEDELAEARNRATAATAGTAATGGTAATAGTGKPAGSTAGQ
jgi:hypothetical protein